MVVPFVELASGEFRMCHICFFYLPEHFHNHIGLISLIAQNFSCYLHFSSCLYGWSNSNVFLTNLTIRTVSGDYILRPCSPELLGNLNWRGGLIWQEEPQTPHDSILYFAHLQHLQTPFSTSESEETWV